MLLSHYLAGTFDYRAYLVHGDDAVFVQVVAAEARTDLFVVEAAEVLNVLYIDN